MGNLLNRGLSFVSFALVTRALGPADYGVLSVGMTALGMVAELTDLGLNNGMVKHASLASGRGEREKAALIYGLTLRARVLIALVALVLGLAGGGLFADRVFHKPYLAGLIRLSLFGIFGILLVGFVVAVFQSRQEFGRGVLVNLAQGAGLLAVIALLFGIGQLNVTSVLLANILLPLGALGCGLWLLPRGTICLRGSDPQVSRELFNFGKWMALWAVAAIIQGRLGILMLTSLTTEEQVGLYSVAYRVASLTQMVSGAYSVVLVPQLSALSDPARIRSHTKRAAIFVALMSVAIGLGALLAPVILPLIVGPAYDAAIPVLRVLLVGMAIFVLNLPFGSALYALNRPQVFAFSAITGLVVAWACNLWLIPYLGAIGAAVTFGIISTVTLLISASAVLWTLRHAQAHREGAY